MAENEFATQVLEPAEAPAPEPAVDAAVRAEQERLAAERQQRREARLAALNPEPVPAVAAAPVASEPVAAPSKPQPTTDRFWPSLGLFLLRLAVAVIMGLHGLDKLLNLDRATELFASTVLPEPQLLALIVGVAEVGIGIGLIFGLLTRVAGLGTALVAGGALAFVLWGPWSAFVPGKPGFTGELEVMLTAAGLLLLFVGGGGWAIDHGFRAGRERDRDRDADV